MYVYRQFQLEVWTVGHYDPNNIWHIESKHQSPVTAAARTAWLNGQPEICPHCGQPVAKEVYEHNEPLHTPPETPKNTERNQVKHPAKPA